MLNPGSEGPAATEDASAEIELLTPRVRREPSADLGGDQRRPVPDALVCELLAELLRAGQPARLRVVGTSMLPSLWPGDRLRVEAAHPGSLQLGDVVVCASGGRLVAHRLIDRLPHEGGLHLITRGDRLRYTDAPVAAEALVGWVVGVGRSGGAERRVPPYRGWRRLLGWLLRRSGRLTGWVLRLRALATPGTGDASPPSGRG
jgi:hypothetical protein